MPPAPAASATTIGVFDSGVGGLSVLRAVRRALPGAALHYLADSRFTPWGQRPAAWVQARCAQLAGWLIDQGCGVVLVACNTGTTQAIAALRRRFPATPFVGVEPGIKPAVAASRNGRVAVLATPGTLASPRLAALIEAHAGTTAVLPLPCPGLAAAIEAADDAPHWLQAELAAAAAAVAASGADTVVLGCTHYPLVADALAQRLAAGVRLIDTAEAVARRVRALAGPGAAAAVAPNPGPAGQAPPGPLQLHATGPVAGLQQAAWHWLGERLPVQTLALPEPLA